MHATVLLEHLAQLVLIHRLGHLAYKHFDVVGIGLFATGQHAQCFRRVAQVVVKRTRIVVVVVAAGDGADGAVAAVAVIGVVVENSSGGGRNGIGAAEATIAAHVHTTVKKKKVET